MFNLSGSEIVFLLLVALIVLGPEKLPEAVRKFGKAYAELKKMTTGFQSELKTALDEPMREMRETAEALKNAVNFDFDAEADDEPADDEPADAESPISEPEARPEDAPPDAAQAATGDADPHAATLNKPLVRPPGPTFHSAAPRPKAEPGDIVEPVEAVDPVEAVEESAAE